MIAGKHLGGITVAMVLPFREDGAIDWAGSNLMRSGGTLPMCWQRRGWMGCC